MNKVQMAACLVAFIAISTSAKTYWKWDCESLSSATTPISGFSGTSKLVTTDPRSGRSCLQHQAIGNDNGSQHAGAIVKVVRQTQKTDI